VVLRYSLGSISYDGLIVKVDDRTLTHLQIVIVNKLRRGEAFLMSWKDAADAGSGRSSIWLHPNVLVHFKFEGSRVPAINKAWLDQLAKSGESSQGLVVTSEDGHLPDIVPSPRKPRARTILDPAPGNSASPEYSE
jgi:hypothetical protein